MILLYFKDTSTHNQEDDDSTNEVLMQSGSGLPSSANRKRTLEYNESDFIAKVASLVKNQLQSSTSMITNPVSTVWRNFDLSPPSTSLIVAENTTPPLHFNTELKKNDLNDTFGKFYYEVKSTVKLIILKIFEMLHFDFI